MEACPHPKTTFPCRVPLKIIGRVGELHPEAITAVIRLYLGLQEVPDEEIPCKTHGTYISFTFWVTLPEERSERTLREAIQKLPGYVMQL